MGTCSAKATIRATRRPRRLRTSRMDSRRTSPQPTTRAAPRAEAIASAARRLGEQVEEPALIPPPGISGRTGPKRRATPMRRTASTGAVRLANRAPSSEYQGGSKGGAEPPLVSVRVIHGVCWLSHSRVAQASPAEPPKTPLRAPPGTTPIEASRASSPASSSPASRTRGQPADPSLPVTPPHSAARPDCHPTPTPRRPEIVDPRPSVARRFPE